MKHINKEKYTSTLCLAGNPNVGKSTLFNALTGLNQHTGNWPGKTVTSAIGTLQIKNNKYQLIDLPGTYSLTSHSKEEEVARDYICFENPDCTLIICDATCLKRNLNLVLQTIEITNNVVVIVNLLDEAKRKNIDINLELLSKIIQVPVIGLTARNKKTLPPLLSTIENFESRQNLYFHINYPSIVEKAITEINELLIPITPVNLNVRWISLKLLENDSNLIQKILQHLDFSTISLDSFHDSLNNIRQTLLLNGFNQDQLREMIGSSITKEANKIADLVVHINNKNYLKHDQKIDHLFTSKKTGYPIMAILLLCVFWITIVGANVPSSMLSNLLTSLEIHLYNLLQFLLIPPTLCDMLVFGVYRVLAWVVSVMLPPMAIFFPLFTLLEDFGYLPRIAFNLDHAFKKCHSCGKQALTMSMGFGCNAAGVIGCRIIDSKRERLIAIITNNFVPCNGRFPTIITLIAIFCTFSVSGLLNSFISAISLTLIILLGVGTTFIASSFLSKTFLKGQPSSITLELPPYRRPDFIKVIVRSIFDRTAHVLLRAVIVAIPAGAIIWILSNCYINDLSIIHYCSTFLDPFAHFIGLDGVILLAFILGFPANEIVIPIIIMIYLSQGQLIELDSITELRALFLAHGWTWLTGLNTILFSLMHWPCATTCLTIKKESGSIKWTLLAIVLPTIFGIILCACTTFLYNFC